MAEDAPSQVDPAMPHEKTEGKAGPIDPSSTKGLARLPSDVKSTMTKADELILRLGKLVKTTPGLNAGLSTLNYSLYVLAYLDTIAPSRLEVLSYISRFIGRTPVIKATQKLPSAVTTPPLISPFMVTGAMVSDFRTTLRLIGLLPLYGLLKSIIAKRNDTSADTFLYRVSIVQCLGYMTFQALENTYHLVNKGVLSPSITATRGGTPKWLMWSCRAWLVGVSSDFFRLGREAQLLQQRKDRGETVSESESKEIDRKWWAEFMTAASWMPVAVHYSVEGGLKGMNLGIVGLCGVSAGLNNFRAAWGATKA